MDEYMMYPPVGAARAAHCIATQVGSMPDHATALATAPSHRRVGVPTSV